MWFLRKFPEKDDIFVCPRGHKHEGLNHVCQKVQPQDIPDNAFWRPFTEESSEGAVEEGEKIKSYRDHAESLSASLMQTLELANGLITSSQELVEQVHEEISSISEECFGFVNELDARKAVDFIHEPFCVIPVGENQSYIFGPKFCRVEVGIPVLWGKNWVVQFVNKWTQMSYPLTGTMSELFQVESAPSLKLLGSKITGPHLPAYWQNIPGTEKDFDHTEQFPSVRISEQRPAKRWLSKNGIAPVWVEEIPDESILASDDWRGLPKAFSDTPRLMACTNDKDEARKAMLASFELNWLVVDNPINASAFIEQLKTGFYKYGGLIINMDYIKKTDWHILHRIPARIPTVLLCNSDCLTFDTANDLTHWPAGVWFDFEEAYTQETVNVNASLRNLLRKFQL